MLGILIAVAVFIYGAYRSYNVLFLAVIASMITFAFGAMDPVEGLTTTFASAFVAFMKSWFLVYVFSAIFGSMMGESGAARSIAVKLARLVRKAPVKYQKFLTILTLPMTSAILTYGGISSLVIVFIVVAIFRDLFIEMDIPWRFYAFSAVGSATFVLGMLPGSPDVVNLAPTTLLGTSAMAAPGLGIIGSLVYLACAITYLALTLKSSNARGEGFYPSGTRISEGYTKKATEEKDEVSVILALLPCITLLVVMNVLGQTPTTALIAANVVCLLLFFKRFDFKKCITTGVNNGISTVAIFSGTIAFGSVVSAVPAFNLVVGGMDSLNALPAIFQVFVAVNVLSAMTSSGTSAITITLNTFGERFLAMGLSADAIHRVASATALGLNTLPHSAAVVNVTQVAKIDMKMLWKDYKWLTVIFPLVGAFVITVLVSFGIVF